MLLPCFRMGDPAWRVGNPQTSPMARPRPVAQQVAVNATEGVSTALLDIYLMRDAVARPWLHPEAVAGLGAAGDLSHK